MRDQAAVEPAEVEVVVEDQVKGEGDGDSVEQAGGEGRALLGAFGAEPADQPDEAHEGPEEGADLHGGHGSNPSLDTRKRVREFLSLKDTVHFAGRFWTLPWRVFLCRRFAAGAERWSGFVVAQAESRFLCACGASE